MDSNFLNYVLKKKGITQEVLAEQIGISRQSLSNRLSGKVGWKIDEIKTVARFLKLQEADVKVIFFADDVN